MIQVDLHATALAVTNTPISQSWKLDGVNLIPFLTGLDSKPPHDALYWRFGEQMAIRSGDWKLVRYDTTADGNEKPEISPWKLYNLADDIHETRDRSMDMPEKVESLRKQWNAWNEANAPPLWGGNGKRK